MFSGLDMFTLSFLPSVVPFVEVTSPLTLKMLGSPATQATARPVKIMHRCARTGAVAGPLSIEPEQYPDVQRSDFTEQLHGVSVPDPYRWLEDSDSADTKACA